MIITTNIRLPEDKWKALKILAVHAGTSVSALVRQAVDHLLASHILSPQAAPPRSRVRDPFFEVIGLGSGGPSDDSVRHDLYLYPKK